MAKTQINFRASALTERQIAELLETTGMSQTELLSTAIDRMYQQEGKMNHYEQFKNDAPKVETISGHRYQVEQELWDQYVGPHITPEEFADGHNDIEAAVTHHIEWWMDEYGGGQRPAVFWKEANAEYEVGELLVSYLERELETE